ncbi:MAG: RsmB/NOP family class I SAM-dependent RNA methyltransferase [Bdellovibrionaceae bacterium]|nr:RsmB/NOP family class I SAM-dependent RNA methyltransferase [Pseudobdellovibrionaceae bacterium]
MNGAELYDQTYSTLWGSRWDNLKKSLLADPHHVARKNLFYFRIFSDKKVEDFASLGIESPYPHVTDCYGVNEHFDINSFSQSLIPFYKMDPASIMAARALNVQEGDHVLDMCAAPGGKTLILAESMGATGSLVANEMSPKRRFRMMSVIKRYVDEQTRPRIDVRGFDGNKYGLKCKNTFDRILLDAPCSGDRGLLHKPAELAEWTPKRPKNFAIRQYALLASAFMALKPGGTLVYSTCAISPFENDGVIDKLFKKKKGEFTVHKSAHPIGESTEHGHLVLPDTAQAGPIYFSVIHKNPDSE